MAVVAAPIFRIPLTTRYDGLFNFFFPRTKCTHTHTRCGAHGERQKNTSCSGSTNHTRYCSMRKKKNRSHNLNGRRTYAKHHMNFIFFFVFLIKTDFCSDAFSFPCFFSCFFVRDISCWSLPIARSETETYIANVPTIHQMHRVCASHLLPMVLPYTCSCFRSLQFSFSVHFFARIKKGWIVSPSEKLRVIDMLRPSEACLPYFPFLLIRICMSWTDSHIASKLVFFYCELWKKEINFFVKFLNRRCRSMYLVLVYTLMIWFPVKPCPFHRITNLPLNHVIGSFTNTFSPCSFHTNTWFYACSDCGAVINRLRPRHRLAPVAPSSSSTSFLFI